ncbi:twin-arginine translocase subunit TatC [Helicobacter cholecystus]|uniref:Sec-independent protein translocase protein TatC n=1 Tax=Helicobacter cholecystus TaxID=45498 RepID=A0A3D8IY11_9HELI|nr:twin-arginine translocase subunit TatC [Helicobacter cholecystus]RDU70152.1 twin-arginine translocase subunit TatC [Helicobacter cholecystus]VEJ24668.1 Sec-independent protein translocase TatC [Helicobacter cholecystus]
MLEDFKPHIQELRKRLIISFSVLGIVFMICFSFWEHIFMVIKEPIELAFAQDIKGELVQLSPAEGVFTAMKVSFLSAIVISLPVIFWQIWLFIAPGLYKHEKMIVIPFVLFATIMFSLGAGFAYFVVFPFIIKYILTFGNAQFSSSISVESYVTFFTRLILGFGLAFELPVISYFLGKVGLITDATLKSFFKYAIVIIFILAAILTPPDILSQFLMAIPLIGLYGLSILILIFVNPAKEEEREE